MNVILKSISEDTDWKAVKTLFDSVGWHGRIEDEIRDSFECSSFAQLAYIGDDLGGCGRIISDGKYYGWIVDLAIHPDFQKHGIGSRLLEHLTNQTKEIKTISLVASDDVVAFYKKHGWTTQSDATMRLNSNGK